MVFKLVGLLVLLDFVVKIIGFLVELLVKIWVLIEIIKVEVVLFVVGVFLVLIIVLGWIFSFLFDLRKI